MVDHVHALFEETRSVVSHAVSQHPHTALFAELGALLHRHCHRQSGPASTQPVVAEWLDHAVETAPQPWQRLAGLLRDATPHLPWLRSYENLDPTPELEAFRSFYSYQLLAGPIHRGHEPPLLMPEVLVGFSLQAPRIFYPQHHHEAPEIYGVISGSLEWQVGETWSTVSPGDVIVHRPHESHAMRTLAEPALTWVAWPRSPGCHVYMPSLDPPDNTMAPTTYPTPT